MLSDQIKVLLSRKPDGQRIVARGWVRTIRESKNARFIEINDGSSFKGIQCVIDATNGLNGELASALSRVTTGTAVSVTGSLVPSPAQGQAAEIAVEAIDVLGEAPAETYPLQKKRHSFEFLREIAHLRPRTNTFGAIARVRNQMAFAIHAYFQERGFVYVHTPIITASDAEGAGAMFQVTTLDLKRLAQSGGQADFSEDFFGKPAFLTVSGQLEAETYATALGRVYTFGPTFRAENSNTTRHLAEFWMIEPEVAFADINDNMDLAEDFLKFIFRRVMDTCGEDLAFFDERIQPGIIDTMRQVIDTPFVRIGYTTAIDELLKAGKAFEFKPYWGCDLQSEHEKYLTEEVYKGPVIVTDYPKEIKAFYMKLNDDGRTVRAMDVLVPRLGEIIGGSQREERLEQLEKRIEELGLKKEDYWWYLDLRRFGTVPHSGFGLGFERLIQYCTGMGNIRDVIPYPRAVKLADF